MSLPIPIKQRFVAAIEWLMQPVVGIRRAGRRLVVQAIRSRFFLLVAIVSAAPLVIASVGYTYKAATLHEYGFSLWLSWAVAVATWVLFLLTVFVRHQRLRQNAGTPKGDA